MKYENETMKIKAIPALDSFPTPIARGFSYRGGVLSGIPEMTTEAVTNCEVVSTTTVLPTTDVVTTDVFTSDIATTDVVTTGVFTSDIATTDIFTSPLTTTTLSTTRPLTTKPTLTSTKVITPTSATTPLTTTAIFTSPLTTTAIFTNPVTTTKVPTVPLTTEAITTTDVPTTAVTTSVFSILPTVVGSTDTNTSATTSSATTSSPGLLDGLVSVFGISASTATTILGYLTLIAFVISIIFLIYTIIYCRYKGPGQVAPFGGREKKGINLLFIITNSIPIISSLVALLLVMVTDLSISEYDVFMIFGALNFVFLLTSFALIAIRLKPKRVKLGKSVIFQDLLFLVSILEVLLLITIWVVSGTYSSPGSFNDVLFSLFGAEAILRTVFASLALYLVFKIVRLMEGSELSHNSPEHNSRDVAGQLATANVVTLNNISAGL